jgi:two-component system chemotaxis response regulator CheB
MRGQVFIAPDDYHLTVTPDGRVRLVDDPPIRGHRPSGDYLLRSVGNHFGPKGFGVVLTGMGQDGAEGMQRLREAGGRTIAQDEVSSVIFGMPKAAVELGAMDQVLPTEGIAAEMLGFAGLQRTTT